MEDRPILLTLKTPGCLQVGSRCLQAPLVGEHLHLLLGGIWPRMTMGTGLALATQSVTCGVGHCLEWLHREILEGLVYPIIPEDPAPLLESPDWVQMPSEPSQVVRAPQRPDSIQDSPFPTSPFLQEGSCKLCLGNSWLAEGYVWGGGTDRPTAGVKLSPGCHSWTES